MVEEVVRGRGEGRRRWQEVEGKWRRMGKWGGGGEEEVKVNIFTISVTMKAMKSHQLTSWWKSIKLELVLVNLLPCVSCHANKKKC